MELQGELDESLNNIDKENEMIEIIEGEIRLEYEEEIKVLKQKLEEQKALVVATKDEYEDRIRKIEEKYELKLLKLIKEVDLAQNKTETIDEWNISPMENYYENLSLLPPILRPEFQFILPMIVSNLDPSSFTHFITTSKKIYSLAQCGYLTMSLKLDLKLKNSNIIPFFTYNAKNLDITDTLNISQATWFRPEVNLFEVCEPEHPADRESWNIEERDEKIVRLLKLLNITYIDSVDACGKVTDFSFLEMCKVRKLKAWNFDSVEYLNYSNFEQVEEIIFEYDYYDNIDFLHKLDLEEHILYYLSADRMDFTDYYFSISIICKIVSMWQERRKHFKCISFTGVEFEDDEVPLEDILKKSKILHSDLHLESISCDQVREMVDDVVPMVISGAEKSFVVIREDHAMISIKFNMGRRNQLDSVILEEMN